MRSYFIRPPYYLRALLPEATWALSTHKNDINISFDDGPHPSTTPILLDLLSKYNMTATFFLLGSQASLYPYLVDAIRDHGHQIGSHGYDHLSGWSTSDKKYIENTTKAAEILDTKLFRPPFGKIKFSQYKQLKQSLRIVMWSLMPGDFDHSVDNKQCIFRMLNHVQKNDIIVLHDQEKIIKQLPLIIENLAFHTKSKGWSYSFIPQ